MAELYNDKLVDLLDGKAPEERSRQRTEVIN